MRLTVDGYASTTAAPPRSSSRTLPLFAYGFRVDPIAQVDDGRLEAIVLRASNRRETLSLLRAAHGGRHLERPGVDWYRGVEARLELDVPLVADAEPLGVTTATIAALPGHLKVVRP